MNILKKILKWFGIVLAVLVVALFVFTSFLINRYKFDVEQAFKNRTGLNARIDGNLQLKILPGFDLVVNKLNLINNETYFLRAETAQFTLDFKSYFLDQKVLITAIRLSKPQVFIFKDQNGIFNYEQTVDLDKNQAKLLKFNLNDVNIADGSLLYFDQGHEDTLLISGINLSTGLIKAEGDIEHFQFSNYTFSGKLGINEFQLNTMHVKKLLLKISCAGGRVSFSPEQPAFYGGILSGNSIIDLSGEDVSTSVNYTVENVMIDSLLMDFETPWYLKGRMKLEAGLQFNSFNWDEVKQSMQGNISLSGENVVVYGFNTGKVINNFEKTGKFSAINAGAALMAVPVDAVFTNDKSLSMLLTNDSGDSLLAKKFISNWKFSQGNAMADDVALSDGKYRIAVSGKVDCLNRTYDNLNISLLSVNGCPVISQQINGSFLQAIIETKSNIEPKSTLQDELASRKKCSSPYSGSINVR